MFKANISWWKYWNSLSTAILELNHIISYWVVNDHKKWKIQLKWQQNLVWKTKGNCGLIFFLILIGWIWLSFTNHEKFPQSTPPLSVWQNDKDASYNLLLFRSIDCVAQNRVSLRLILSHHQQTHIYSLQWKWKI